MLNFTTTTIVNSTDGLFSGSLANAGRLYVKNVGSFTAAEIKKAYKKVATPEQLASTTVTATAPAIGDIYRLVIDIELHKSDSSIYARPWPTKGKPVYVEAMAASEDAVALATALVKNASEYMNLVYDKQILNVSNIGGSDGKTALSTITITGVDGTQNLKSVVLEKWVENVESYAGGKWVNVVTATPSNGKPAFGNYQHLIHNVVLPTYENTRDAILDVEGARTNAPMLSGSYTQYVITKEADRDPYGMQAVGQKLTSVTEHVFWVESDAVTAFETAFGGASKFDANDANKDGYELVSILED